MPELFPATLESPTETTLAIPKDASYLTGVTFLVTARELLNEALETRPEVHARFWFEDQHSLYQDRVWFTAGPVVEWGNTGMIRFADGSELNDKLLLRVSF